MKTRLILAVTLRLSQGSTLLLVRYVGVPGQSVQVGEFFLGDGFGEEVGRLDVG